MLLLATDKKKTDIKFIKYEGYFLVKSLPVTFLVHLIIEIKSPDPASQA